MMSVRQTRGKRITYEAPSSDEDFEDDSESELTLEQTIRMNDGSDKNVGKRKFQSLCLSDESFSSSDESDRESLLETPKTRSIAIYKKNCGSDTDVTSPNVRLKTSTYLTNKLDQLASTLSENLEDELVDSNRHQSSKSRMKRNGVKARKKTKQKSNNDDDDDIAKLLRLGESKKRKLVEDSSEDEEFCSPDYDFDENELPSANVSSIQITIGDQNVLKNEMKSKKKMDLQTYVRREIAKTKRFHTLLIHQTQLMCCVAHVRYLSFTVNNELLQATILSMVPASLVCFSSNCQSFAKSGISSKKFDSKQKKEKSIFDDIDSTDDVNAKMPSEDKSVTISTLRQITQLMHWFRGAFKVSTSSRNSPGPIFHPKLAINLICTLFQFKVPSGSSHLVFAFLALLRALGWKARLAYNCPVLSLKSSTTAAATSKSTQELCKKGLSKSKSTPDLSTVKVESSKHPSKKLKLGDVLEKENVEQSNGKVWKKSKSSSTLIPRKDETGDESCATMNATRSSLRSASSTSQTIMCSSRRNRLKQKEKEEKIKKISEAAIIEAKSRVSPSKRPPEASVIKRPMIQVTYPPNTDDNKSLSPELKRAKKFAEDEPVDYWIEFQPNPVQNPGLYVTLDVVRGRVECHDDMWERTTNKSILYILSADPLGCVKDVTMRYRKNYMTTTRKQRVDQNWFQSIIAPFKSSLLVSSDAEDRQLLKYVENAPLPKHVGAFKSHPLYALKRHLLKFEAFYPENPTPVGYVNGEEVYPRDCVQTLQWRGSWVNQGRCVKVNEKPYKIVTARPKYDHMSGKVIKDRPLDLFGLWQTDLYKPPKAENGVVPRNEYGNVELFKEWMLPEGTVHIKLPSLTRLARKLKIDCAPAVNGWEFKSGANRPVFDGYVICKEYESVLTDAWNEQEEMRVAKAEEIRTKRLYDNWRKLIKGVLVAEKVRLKYSV